ncbi:unnamed protein product [Symbiodinium natans]|uniref:Methyltransferase FkbM domain-containing protein n=1 Tax=Symbiodinium natans TaxID=878477 RepID=A0A812QA13_9DINO|nr:unnamed protein product [Symbiodinium natans]
MLPLAVAMGAMVQVGDVHSESISMLEELDLHRAALLQDSSYPADELHDVSLRCWTVAMDPHSDPEVQWRCRFILVFLFGQGQLVQFPEQSCEQWAFLSMPDRVLRAMDQEMMGRFYRPGQEYQLPDIPPSSEVWIVGAFSSGPHEVGQILRRKPSRIHFFEPITEFFEQLKLQWHSREYAQLHNYGLGRAREHGEMFMASEGSSLFQPMEFSAKRLFLDSVSDPEHGRLRERRTHVRVEDAEVVWRILSTEDLGLLHMNCEGCEYEVIPQLAAAGLLDRIQAIFVAPHLVLNDDEAAELCDASSGTCQKLLSLGPSDTVTPFRGFWKTLT